MQFELKHECDLKYLFFFHGEEEDKESDKEMDSDDFINKPKGYMKKNYLGVQNDGEIMLKNLGIRKRSTSKLSKIIFFDHMVPKIKTGQIKFSRAWVRNLIYELLEKNLNLAALRKDVGPIEQYSKSPTGLQAQLAQRYGQGIHWIVPNTAKVGVGKGKSYCTIEEFKEHKLKLEHIDLDFIWQELSYFLKPIETKSIFEYTEEEK